MIDKVSVFKDRINSRYQDDDEIIFSVIWDRQDIERALTYVSNPDKDRLVLSKEVCVDLFNRASNKCSVPGMGIEDLTDAIEDYLKDKRMNFIKGVIS